MIVAVLSNGSVDTQSIDLPPDTSDVRLAAVTAHLQRALIGSTLDSQVSVSPSGDADVDLLADRALDALRRGGEDQPVFVVGASSMARAFDAVDTVRMVLRTLEQQFVVVSLLRDILDRGLTVAIGAEHGVEPLASCSVVVAPVIVDGEQVGTVGVLGPTRMNYPRALATVGAVSEQLGKRLGDGGGVG
jgi:heat-inducible transcriptional repressor